MEDDRGSDLNRLGVYRIEDALGQGGMGEVFLAWDERLSRHVAIKRIRTDKPLDEIHHARFRREARVVARVSHPAIVQVYDVFEAEDGSDCIVMEHVDGKSLAELLKRRAIDLELALRLAAEVADGLAEAHAKGLIHRDLKAENVMVTSSGHAKILDFGLARALWPTVPGEEEARLSESGALVGTAHAMSPEQAGGQNVDHRSDLFALGSLLYEMLAGRAPFRGTNLLDSLRRVISIDAEPLGALRPELPPELARLVDRLLAKDPGKRPQNARLVADELEQIRARMTFQAESSEARAADLESLPTLAGVPRPPHVETYKAVSDGSVIVRTLVMTDLVRSTQLIGSLGDERAFEISGHHDRTARDLLKKLGGLEIDKSDGFLLLFERPADAVAYALAYHRSLVRLSEDEGVELSARVGIHLGEVRLRHNSPEDVSRGAKPLEVEGIAKPTAARLMSLAGPRQTLLTRTAFDLARRVDAAGELAGPDLRWLAHGAYAFQGVEEPIEIFEVGREGLSPLVEPEDNDKVRRVVSIQDELVLGWRPAAGQGIPRRKSWVLVEKVGRGGFGEVWLARHKSGEKRVFKFCFEANRLRGLKREVTLFRLLKEALGHREDIARILDWNFDVAPFYLEAEYTEDGNLAEWVEQQGGAAGIPLETRLSLVADVAEALAAAHSVGVLHKDVKPENVLVTHDHDGRVRAQLTDFGIGLLTDRERLDSGGVTVMGFTAMSSTLGSSEGGTLGYMAPEVMQGRLATVQADVYSLGVMLYQLVAGDFGRALATGWQRDVEDEILVEDIAACVDGVAARRPSSALVVAEWLRRLEERRSAREAERRMQQEAEEARLAFLRAQRRRKVFASIAAVAVAVSAVVTLLSLLALSARRDAELRREQAADLINFMFSDLVRKLENIGKLDMMNDASVKALEYFSSVPDEQLTDRDLLGRSKALRQLGWVRNKEGQGDAALEAFRQARESLQVLFEKNPQDRDQGLELADVHFQIGSILLKTGDFDGALRELQGQLDLVETIAARIPDDPDVQLHVAYSRSNIGYLFQERGDARGALTHYLSALEVKKRLLADDPGSSEKQNSLANSYNLIGGIQVDLGRLPDALDSFLESQDLFLSLVEQNSANNLLRYRLAVNHNHLGRLLGSMGRWAEASQHLDDSLAIARQLVEHDGSQVPFQRLLATSLLRKGIDLRRQGELEEALEHLRKSEAMFERLTDSSNVTSQVDLAAGRIALGELFLRSGDAGAALSYAQGALSGLSPLAESLPGDTEVGLRIAEACLLLGRATRSLSGRGEAERFWRRAAAVVEPLLQEDVKPQILDLWARTLFYLGRGQEAERVVRRLAEMSYVFVRPTDFQ